MLYLQSVSQAGLKSTLRPLYAFTQATPKSVFLDSLWDRSVDIYPGMAMQKVSGNNVTLAGASGTKGGRIEGLAGEFVAPKLGIDMLKRRGMNGFSVWVLGPDAEFEVLEGAFDTQAAWVDPADGTALLICAYLSGPKQGLLAPSTASGTLSAPFARLIEVVSPQKIKIGGLQGTV